MCQEKSTMIHNRGVRYYSHHVDEYPIHDTETKKLVRIMKKRYPHLKRVQFRYLPMNTTRGNNIQGGSASIKKVWINPNMSLPEKVKIIKHELRHVEQFRAGINTDIDTNRWERDAEMETRRLFDDDDKDGVPNVFDCEPNNPNKQDKVRWY